MPAIRALLIASSDADHQQLTALLSRETAELDMLRVRRLAESAPLLENVLDIAIAVVEPGSESSPRALLQTIRTADQLLPVVLIVESMEARDAIELMKEGADDLVFRSELSRLHSAVQAALLAGTKRRQHSTALAQLRSSEERFRATFENAATGLAHVSPSGEILRANSRFGEITGQLRDAGYLEIFPSSERRQESQALATLFSRGGSTPCEKRILRPDGTHGWIIRSMALATDDCGYAVVALEDITSRKLVEEALRGSERRFRFLAEQASDAIFLVSSEGRILETNQQGGELIGCRRDELIGTRVDQLFDSDELARMPLQLNRPAGQTMLWERTLTRRDGTKVAVEVSGRALEGGGLLGLARDVTQRHELERARRRAEELFQLVSRATADGVYDWDITRDRLWVNESFRLAFGHPEAEYVDVEWWEQRIHPDDCEAVMSGLVEALRGDADRWTADYRFARGDGSWAHVVDRGTLIREAGTAVRMVGSMLDITLRREAEEALRASEERLRAVIEVSEDIIALLDSRGRIRFVSPSVRRTLGWSHDQLLGTNAGELFHPDDLPRLSAAFAELLSSPGAVSRAEFRLRAVDGSSRDFEGVAVNALDRKGIGGVLVTCRDVSERIRVRPDRP